MKNDDYSEIYMNTEIYLPIHRTFLQVYNSTELAREQVLDDYNKGHISESKYNAIICALNSPTVCVWTYVSIRSDSKVVGVCRDNSMVRGYVNMNALLALYCDVFERILKANQLKMSDIYDSHWLTYLSETIFMHLHPLYISDKHDYTLSKQFYVNHEYTVYNTNIITVLSEGGSDVKREYPDYIAAPLRVEAEKLFCDAGVQGVCLKQESTTPQLVAVKINTAPSPHGYMETMATLFHEMNHTVARLLKIYERNTSVTQYEVLYRQLITSYVYSTMISMAKEMWDVTDKKVESPQIPDLAEQLLLPITQDSR